MVYLRQFFVMSLSTIIFSSISPVLGGELENLKEFHFPSGIASPDSTCNIMLPGGATVDRTACFRQKTEFGRRVVPSDNIVLNQKINSYDPPGLGIELVKLCQEQNDSVARAEALIRGGADVNYEDGDGQTALQLCSRYGHKDVVKLLLDKDAKVDGQDRQPAWQYSALMWACKNGQDEIVEMLLRRNAQLELVGECEKPISGCTALHHCVQFEGSPESVRLLLERGANANYLDDLGRTPLMKSVRRDPELVELLLQYADSSIVDKKGKTACDYAGDLDRELDDPGARNILDQVRKVLISNGNCGRR